jgi:hypothetical protein
MKEESMTRFGLVVLLATLSLGPMSCGSSTSESENGGAGGSSSGNGGSGGGSGGSSGGSSSSAVSQNPLDLIPVDNTVSGWTIDTGSNIGGSTKAMTGATLEEGGKLIDGGIEPFYSDGFTPKLFIWQNYKNGSLPDAPVDKDNPLGAAISLYVFQMPSAQQASGMYKNLLKYSEYTRKSGTTDDWKDTSPVVGDGARIQDSGADWWINFYKGIYYVEIKLTPSNGPAPDFTPGNENLKKESMRFAQALASKL